MRNKEKQHRPDLFFKSVVVVGLIVGVIGISLRAFSTPAEQSRFEENADGRTVETPESVELSGLDHKKESKPERGKKKVYVAPLGKVGRGGLSTDEVEFVGRSLRAFFDVEVEVLPAVELPKWAYYSPRRRYWADKLLEFLNKRLETVGGSGGKMASSPWIMGLTASDISVTKGKHKDWGVIGYASVDGSVSVVSTFRTRR